MSNLPEPTDLVLVAFLPSPRDLEIARVLGWYRIPLRTSPKIVAPDYVAFYQPATFGDDHKWLIELVAPVKGHELALRRELFKEEPDHPHAMDEYYKLQLDSLVELPKPIKAGTWKRITFFYTTGELVLSAHSIDDLGVPDEERAQIYQSLREKAIKLKYIAAPDLPELPINLEALALFTMQGNAAAYFGDPDAPASD